MLMLPIQAIVNIELQKPNNEPLVIESIQQAKQLYEQYASVITFEQFASEVMVSSTSQLTNPHCLTQQPQTGGQTFSKDASLPYWPCSHPNKPL